MARQLLNAFNAGEFTPELLGRVDLESIRKACRLLRNFIPRTLGGVRRRPGLMRLGAAKMAGTPCRLLPFNFSTDARFVLELGDGYLRFWRDGALVSGEVETIELAAPWTAAQLNAVQMVQVNDLVFFTHPAFPVQELRRVTDTSWTLGALAWRWPAMRDRNSGATTMACSVTTGTGELVASAAQFAAGDVGGYYEVTHRRDVAQVELALTATATGTELRVLGTWEVFSFGTWDGTLFLETFDTDGTWRTLRSWAIHSDDNIQANGRVDVETRMRLRFVHTSHSGTVPARAKLAAIDPEIHGLVRVDAVTDSTHAEITVIRDLHATTATPDWAEGAWSTRRGFPRACAIHQQRFVLAGNAAEPQKVWGSAINDFNNFQLLDLDDAAFAIQVAAQEANPIVWLASQEGLIVGTEGDEWLMDSGDVAISLTNPPNSKRKTKFGSADVQAQLVGSVVLFIQRGGRAMREYVFAFDEQGYKAPDLTQLSEHMTRSGIVSFCFAQNPDSTIWAVTADGRLLSCTYRRESEVVAWAQHETDGAVESVTAIYGVGDADEIWCSVRRTINGVTSRHIERFDPDHWDILQSGETERPRLVYFDCSGRFEFASPVATVSGLEWLEGATVSVRVDGAAQTPRKVSGGSITLAEPGRQIVVGLPFTSRLQPFLFDTQLQDGTAQGLAMRTPEIRVRLYLTGAMQTGDSEAGPFRDVTLRNALDSLDAPAPLFTGLTAPIYHQSNYTDGTNCEIRTDSGEPLNVLAVIAQTGIHAR